MEEGLEEARRRMLEEIQKKMEMEEQVKANLRTVLEDDAYERMINVKVANPELFMSAAQGCVSVSRRLGRKLREAEVLLILRRLKQTGEKETRITFERK